MAEVGTMEWGRLRGGKLTLGESWGQVLLGLQARLQQTSGRWLRRFGLGSPRLPQAAWQGLELPNSPLAGSATELCLSCSPGFLVQHCFRSYAWAVLLGHRDGLRYDPEVLYLACMLHDLGLTDQARPSAAIPCFAISGAREAERFLSLRECPADRRQRVCDAIALHLNVQVGAKDGAEAHLLRQGSGFDVIGARYHHIGPEARNEVLQRYPREDFAGRIRTTLADPAACCSRTRLDLLCRVGFLGMVGRCPLG